MRGWRWLWLVVAVMVVGWGMSASPARAQGTCATYGTYSVGSSFGPSDVNGIQVLLGQTNMIPTCVDSYSNSASQMQDTRNPYPSDTISLAVDLKEELTGLRYALKALTGWSQWYTHTEGIARAQTWNAAGTNFCAFCETITDTASHSSSRLMDLGVVSGSVTASMFSVTKGGLTTTRTLAVEGTGAFGSITLTSPLGVAYGGLGGSFSATARGSLFYFSGTGTIAALGPGTSGYFLQTQGAGANPIWAAVSSLETGTWSADLGPAGTAARAGGVEYQNTSGKKRRVWITMTGASSIINCVFLTDSTTPVATQRAQIVIDIDGTAGLSVDRLTFGVIEIPSAWYYRLNITTGTITTWFELDE